MLRGACKGLPGVWGGVNPTYILTFAPTPFPKNCP